MIVTGLLGLLFDGRVTFATPCTETPDLGLRKMRRQISSCSGRDDSSFIKLSRRVMPTVDDPAKFTATSPKIPRSSSAALHLALAVISSDLHDAKVNKWQHNQRSRSLPSPRPGSGAAVISTSSRVLRAALPAEAPSRRKEYDSRKDDLRRTYDLIVHGVKPTWRRSSSSVSSSSSSSTFGRPTCYQSVKARFPNLAFSRTSLHGPHFLLGQESCPKYGTHRHAPRLNLRRGNGVGETAAVSGGAVESAKRRTRVPRS